MTATSSAKASYEEWHGRYDVDRAIDTPWHRLALAHLDPDRDLAGKQILEIACGRGGFACRLGTLTSPAPRVVAADFSLTAVAKGRLFGTEQGISAVRWEVGDAQSLCHAENFVALMGLYRGYVRVLGRPYTEEGQPINRFMLLPRTIQWLRAAGFRILTVDARGRYLPWPGHPPIEMPFLEKFRWLRWLALHSLVLAQKGR